MYKQLFFKKNILITGGTGSIGSEVLESLLSFKPKKIYVFSRDEYKQHKLRYKYTDNSVIDYLLGDVRDLESVNYACKEIDVLFHCAALKHVPTSEEMPEEFIKTNIHGCLNIKKASLANNIPLVVSISTDKAVDPLNVMGLTKAIQEKIFSSSYLQNHNKHTRFINVRFGNVIGTHGSLFPILYHQIKNNFPLTITHTDMTRFFMTKKEAVNLIFWAAQHGQNGETVIKKMKSSVLIDLTKNFINLMKKSSNDYPMKITGIRVGEKMHEYLITSDEIFRTYEKQGYYIISPYTNKEINKNIINLDNNKIFDNITDFASNNPKNYFNQDELNFQIKIFIKEIKSASQFI